MSGVAYAQTLTRPIDEWLDRRRADGLQIDHRPNRLRLVELALWIALAWPMPAAVAGVYLVGVYFAWLPMTVAVLATGRRPRILVAWNRRWVQAIVRLFAYASLPGMPIRQIVPGLTPVMTVRFIEEREDGVRRFLPLLILIQLLPSFLWTVLRVLVAWPVALYDGAVNRQWSDRVWKYCLWNIADNAVTTAYAFQLFPDDHPVEPEADVED